MKRLSKAVIVAMTLSGCAAMKSSDSGTVLNGKVRVFPSPLASESDFLNLGSEDGSLRAQAFKNVSVYYNCLVKATPKDYRRQDPTLVSQSEIVAFSEIPAKIHEFRIQKLASLVSAQNRNAVQGIIDAEIKDFGRIKWEDIKKAVNAIVAGARRDEVERNSCPLPDSETEPQRVQLAQEWWLLKPVFFPPFM